jgi:hypothetical protein
MSNCIGVRNVKCFAGFVFLTSFLCVGTIVLSVVYLVRLICPSERPQLCLGFWQLCLLYLGSALLIIGIVVLLCDFLDIVLRLWKGPAAGLPFCCGVVGLFLYCFFCIGFQSVTISPAAVLVGVGALGCLLW